MITNRKKLLLGGKEIDCVFKRGGRLRNIRLSVFPGGEFVVSYPARVNISAVEKFISSKSDWILKNVEKMSKYKKVSKSESRDGYLKNKEKAREIIFERLNYFNQFYKFKYNRVFIKNQKSRWGSCSKNGNLNFNYKLVFLNERQRDYVIVHELCHLKELNHSRRFWDLVVKTFPDYSKVRKQLRSKREVVE